MCLHEEGQKYIFVGILTTYLWEKKGSGLNYLIHFNEMFGSLQYINIMCTHIYIYCEGWYFFVIKEAYNTNHHMAYIHIQYGEGHNVHITPFVIIFPY